MKVKKRLQHKRKHIRCRKNTCEVSLRGLATITICAVIAVVVAVGSSVVSSGKQNQVYAASENDTEHTYTGEDVYTLPTGIAGVVSGVGESPMPGSTINRIGTSCEQVLVGQRVQKVESNVTELNVSDSMASTVDSLDSTAVSRAESAKMMSDTDYNTLLRIVEAEAGGEDLKGKILVANVIMNRVKHEEFPDTVTDVVWEYRNGVPQFSPTYDGRINTVTVSDETREAVKQVLEGVDYSDGALFFIQKSAAEAHNVEWFEADLKSLFKHGVHEFYTYYTEEEQKEREEAKKKEEAKKAEEQDLVQMVKKEG